MKRIFAIAFLTALIANPCLAATTIVGSSHDMIASGFAVPAGGATNQVCVFCHTPHGADTSVTQAPLWNNTPALTVDPTMYSSATINFVFDDTSINATDARLCLSCHDSGVGNLVNLPNVGSYDPGAAMDANALLGTNMANDHPIGMNLTANPELIDLTWDPVPQANIHTIGYISDPARFNGNPFYGASNTMWCSTCHDVHDNTNIPFLRMSNVGSAMCKACHIK